MLKLWRAGRCGCAANPCNRDRCGGGTAPYRVLTSDLRLSSVTVNGSIMSVGLGQNGNRCIASTDEQGVYIPSGTYDVTVTAIDSLGASATAIMTLKDNGLGLNQACP